MVSDCANWRSGVAAGGLPPPGSLMVVAHAAGALQGTVFTCVANGKTFSGDRPPPECANSDIRELNRDGSLRRIHSRPLTLEEQRARAYEAKRRSRKKKNCRRNVAAIALCSTPTPMTQEIEQARAKSMETSKLVDHPRDRSHRAPARRTRKLDDEVEFYKKREVPDHIKRGFVELDQQMGVRRAAHWRGACRDAAGQRALRRGKRRFGELLAQGARPVQRNPEPDILLDPRFRNK
jgi:hypothetical protein